MKKCMTDLATGCVCLAVFGIAWFYPEQVRCRDNILWISAIAAAVCFCMAFLDQKREKRHSDGSSEASGTEPDATGMVTELVLLSEEDTELMVWNLYGRVSVLIGRSGKDSEADIDLGQGPYAGMVDPEHAVLNYSSGRWYAEDLGSRNGLSVKKSADGKVYRLSPDTPCRLEKGDCLHVGMNRLLLR